LSAPLEPTLSDGIISLRPFTEADVPAITAACQDPDIPRRTLVPSPYSEDDARAWVRSMHRGRERGDLWNFAIADTESGELLGSIGIRLVDANGQIGYWVKREARGRGVATRALRLVSRWGLETLGLARLQLLTEPDNVASQRVAERAGFTREALLRSYMELKGRRADAFMYALLPADLRP
jgi:RimJ/RimL family protein N-acetyltransferase